MQKNIFTGTSGFIYKDWKGKFYPFGLPQRDYLKFYTGKFNALEINSSFYRLPSLKAVAKWYETFPDDFKFSPKMSRYLTHMKKLNDPEEPTAKFLERFSDFRDKMGPVIIQLPANLKFNYEKVLHFFKLLKTKYTSFEFVLEARNFSWFGKDSLNLLKEFEIGNVVSYSGGQFPYCDEITSRNIYLRFHGPGLLYGSDYKIEELRKIAKRWKNYAKKNFRIYSFFNNDVNAFATDNAREFYKLMIS